MKKIIFCAALLAVLAVVLSACSGGGTGAVTGETEDYSDLVANDAKTVRYTDLGMSAYSFKSSARRVADAVVTKSETTGIVVRAYNPGKAVITITDYWGRTGELEVTVDSKCQITETKVLSKPEGGIDLRAYGASGSGGASDAEVLQQAIAELGKNGGGTLYIPAGRYKINSSITVGENISMELQGSVENVKDGYTDELKSSIENGEFAVLIAPAFQNCDPSGPGREGKGNISIHGGVLDMEGYIEGYGQVDVDQKGPAVGKTKSNCMIFANASGLRFENVVVKDIYNGHAFQITGADDILIKDCLFAGYVLLSEVKGSTSSSDVVTNRETIQVEYAHSGAIPPTFYEEGEYYFCHNFEITGCCFTKSDKAGYHAIPIGQHGMNGRPNCTGMKITDNVFDNPYIYGMRLLCYHDVEIRNNLFVSSIASTGYNAKMCAMIYLPLQNGDKKYDGTRQDGKTTSIMFCNGWEQDGTKNVVIESNTFEICKGSYFKVMIAASNSLDIGAKSVEDQIRQAEGQIYGEKFTGLLPVSNVIDGLSFEGNTVKFGGKPADAKNWMQVKFVRNFLYEDNSVSGYSKFTDSADGVNGLSLSGVINGNDAKTRTISTSLTDKKVTLYIPGSDNIVLASDGSARNIVLKADDGVQKIEFTFKDGHLLATAVMKDGYTFAGWESDGAHVEPGKVNKLGSDVTLTATSSK